MYRWFYHRCVPDYCTPAQRLRILQLLKERERSVSWLARQLGMNESLLHHRLRGRRRLTEDFFLRLVAIFDVPIDDLLAEPTAA